MAGGRSSPPSDTEQVFDQPDRLKASSAPGEAERADGIRTPLPVDLAAT
jgi:hypothetical protein